MYNFHEDILDEAPPNFDGEDTTPIIKSLFQVDDAALLNKEMVDKFHRTFKRFLYAAKMTRVDI